MADIVKKIGYAMSLRGCTIEELRLPPDGAATPITYASMSVQEIDWDACRAAIEDTGYDVLGYQCKPYEKKGLFHFGK